MRSLNGVCARLLGALAIVAAFAVWIVASPRVARADDCSGEDVSAAISQVSDPGVRADLMNTFAAIMSAQANNDCDEFAVQVDLLFQQVMTYNLAGSISIVIGDAIWQALGGPSFLQTCLQCARDEADKKVTTTFSPWYSSMKCNRPSGGSSGFCIANPVMHCKEVTVGSVAHGYKKYCIGG